MGVLVFFAGCKEDKPTVEIQQFTLTISYGPIEAGEASPAGGDYDAGTVVILTATPNTYYRFKGWTGDAISDTNPISITMDANKSVEVIFEFIDSDNDRIPDELDQCENTPQGAVVNELGCEVQITYSNILLIVADDIGNDMLAGFNDFEVNARTPTLDSLRASGISFTNVWASPICSPTRAGLISGQYGFRTGVLNAGDQLDENTRSIQQRINVDFPDTYQHGIIGKWHLSGQPTIRDHPYSFGFDYFAGVIGGSVGSYTDYSLIFDKQVNREDTYATQKFTELATDWIAVQDQPWFLWMTHVAPHTPYEIPPMGTYTQASLSDDFGKYLASIEALDYYINDLITQMDEETKANTLFIFIGDNGTENSLLRGYSDEHGKGTLYEGGVRVPMIISGPNVTRSGVVDNSMIQSLDLPGFILNYIGGEATFEDSQSFLPLLTASGSHRSYLYSESVNSNNSAYAVRNDFYKFWVKNNREEFYYHGENLLENEDLLKSDLTVDQQNQLDSLRNFVTTLKNE